LEEIDMLMDRMPAVKEQGPAVVREGREYELV